MPADETFRLRVPGDRPVRIVATAPGVEPVAATVRDPVDGLVLSLR